MTWSILLLEASMNTANSTSFLDAKEPLLKAVLIYRSGGETESLTIHRLIEAAIMKRLTPKKRVNYFDATITICLEGTIFCSYLPPGNSGESVAGKGGDTWKEFSLLAPE
jgi:hypothetical protein